MTVLRTRPVPPGRLIGAVGALVALDLLGGVIAVVDRINSVRDAWGSAARLAAPWPMIAAQVILTCVAVGSRRRGTVAAPALLALACAVSAVSGFFDGGLADPRLAARHVAVQRVLIAWTAVVGVLAAERAVRAAGR